LFNVDHVQIRQDRSDKGWDLDNPESFTGAGNLRRPTCMPVPALLVWTGTC